MNVIFLKELKLTRKGLIIWCVVMLITIGYGMAEYPMISGNSDTIMQSMNMLPRVVLVMFGMDGLSLKTSLDYHLVMYYWVSLIAFTHAAIVGATMLSKDQRDKTSEYIYTKPYKRGNIITAKILVGLLNILVMTLVTWIGSVGTLIFIDGTVMAKVNGASMLALITITMIGMFLTQLVFLAIGLLCSAFLKTHKAAIRSSFSFIFATYSVSVIIQYVGTIGYLNFLSPFQYFNVVSVVSDGISLIYVLVDLVVVGTSIYLTYDLYNKRDLLI